jgi:hypothetical protein
MKHISSAKRGPPALVRTNTLPKTNSARRSRGAEASRLSDESVQEVGEPMGGKIQLQVNNNIKNHHLSRTITKDNPSFCTSIVTNNRDKQSCRTRMFSTPTAH